MSRTFSMKKGSDDNLKTSVRLQSEGAPDAADGIVAQAAALGHGPGAPVGSVPGRGLRRQRNHPLHVVISDRPRATDASFVRQPVQSPLYKPRPPLAHRRARHPRIGRHRSVAPARRAGQNIRARSARACAVFGRRIHRSRVSRSASSKINDGIGRRMAMVVLHLGCSPGGYPITHAFSTYFGYRTLAALGCTIWASLTRDLTDLEYLLFGVITLIAGLLGSYRFGQVAVVNRQYAHSALRSVLGRVVKLSWSRSRWRESGSWPGMKPLSWRSVSPPRATV